MRRSALVPLVAVSAVPLVATTARVEAYAYRVCLDVVAVAGEDRAPEQVAKAKALAACAFLLPKIN